MSLFPKGTPIGVNDGNGDPIHAGDRVVYRLEEGTKDEYKNPEYIVVYEAPAFTLKWVGGGKDGGSHDFKLRCGGANGDLMIVRKTRPPLPHYVLQVGQSFDDGIFADDLDEAKRIITDYMEEGVDEVYLFRAIRMEFAVERVVSIEIRED